MSGAVWHWEGEPQGTVGRLEKKNGIHSLVNGIAQRISFFFFGETDPRASTLQ